MSGLQHCGRAVLAAYLSCITALAWSQCPNRTEWSSENLDVVYRCADGTERYKEYQWMQPGPATTQSEAMMNLVPMVEALRAEVESMFVDLSSAPGRSLAEAYYADWGELVEHLSNGESERSEDLTALLAAGRWRPINESPDGHLNSAIVETKRVCALAGDGEASACREAVGEVGELATYSLITEVLVAGYYNADPWKVALATERAIGQRFESYLEDLPFQYPWELFVNRAWVNCGFNRGELIGTSGVLKDSPKCRFMLFHPDIGVAYAGEAPDGDKIQPTFIVELFGFVRYGFDEENSVKNPWGVSVSSTFADLPGADDVGIGVTLRFREFGLTVSDHGDETIYLLNLNLLEFVGRSLGQWKEGRQKLEEIFMGL